MKFWLRFAEKFGSPWVIGKHPRGANDAEIEKLLDSMEQMVEDAVAAIPMTAVLSSGSGWQGRQQRGISRADHTVTQ
ncbi:DUF935 domain-containing protein [Escherichia coli]|nr:DUF935 domain-containing protein [Escherichia coli]